MGASGSLVEPPCQPVVKIVEAIYKANCNIKMNSIMIPPPSKLRFNFPFRAWVNALGSSSKPPSLSDRGFEELP